jgi:hypothetical protein
VSECGCGCGCISDQPDKHQHQDDPGSEFRMHIKPHSNTAIVMVPWGIWPGYPAVFVVDVDVGVGVGALVC